MLKRILSIVATLALFVPTVAFAQTGVVTGTVTDARNDEAVPGANVALTEINRGAATDIDGNYTIEQVPVGTYTLRVTFVGYENFVTEITIDEGETVTQDVELQPGEVGLEEVVVTGYGQQETREQISASVSQVNASDIENLPNQSAEGLLQGRTPGVTVQSSSGNPGGGFDVNIRGQGSITAGSEPLYIVDGVQLSNNDISQLNSQSPLASINPSDIESIRVLKDAAASAIYGAQASNGVVLIQTKSGQAGDTRVNVNFEGGIRSTASQWNPLTPREWQQLQIDAFGGGDAAQTFVQNNIYPAFGYAPGTEFEDLRKTNWQDIISRQGAHRSVGFSASGGDEDTQFFISGNWEDTESGVRDVSFEQFQFRTNLTQQFTENLRVKANANLSAGDQPGVCQDGFFINCPWSGIQFSPPITFAYNQNGTYSGSNVFGTPNNQEVVLEEENRPVELTNIQGSLQPTYSLTPWFNLRASLGLDWQTVSEVDHESTIAAPGNAGSTSNFNETVTNFTLNWTGNFNKSFAGVHDVSALVGNEYRREFSTDNGFGVAGFNQDLLTVPDAGSRTTFFFGDNTEFRLFSYFGNVNYTYDGRYTFKFTSRWDGASRFGANERFGWFPSVSGAWRITEEDFFDYDVVNSLKLRASWGKTGNSDIGDFASRGLFSTAGTFEGQIALDPDQLANTALTWEEKTTWNLGLDYAFFSNRLTGSVEVYRSTNSELLLGSPLPRSSGFADITDNVGEVRNRGIEFSVETVNLRTEEFRWSTRFNAGINQNEVLELNEGQEVLFGGADRPVEVGRPINGWKVPRWAGVNPADGRPMWLDEDGNITYETSSADDVAFDGAAPDAEGGFGTTVSWKGLTLDAFFQFSYGGHVQPETIQAFMFNQSTFSAGHAKLTERWREPGDITSVPRAVPEGIFPNAQGFDTSSRWWLFRTDYLRFKNARLGYNLPTSVTEQIGLNNVRVYLSGTNLVTWTSFIGLDPEQADPEAESSFPNERQINFGIDIQI